MESRIIPFLFEGEITVRVVDHEGSPWFVAADVCHALGLSNPSEAVGGLDTDEKDISIADSLGGYPGAVIISESGLFALIFESRKPHAARFRKWVTAEVLPSIRRAGYYGVLPPTSVIPAALALRIVNAARYAFGNRVAQQMWFMTGLPIVAAMRLGPDQGDLLPSRSLPGSETTNATH